MALMSQITTSMVLPAFFQDPGCWSGRGLNPQPSARQTGAISAAL